MRSTFRLPRWPLALGVLAAFLLVACQQAAPAAAPQQKRKSFEDSGEWHPAAAPAAAPAASGDVNAQARQVQRTWDKARQAPNEAEAQRQASEALKQTQQMADQPPPH
ncbi:MAG TPA: hypothetical protein VGV61_16655 [Thermoanaerobaculia bacterium]|jgi:hypothetical protein|nr:hypothetical protein [Thermoanaerobaculia bacterium]